MFGAATKKASTAVETPKGPTMSPLHWAAWHGQEEGLDTVLSLDKLLSLDKHGTNKHGDTLLHCAGIIQTVFRECRKSR